MNHLQVVSENNMTESPKKDPKTAAALAILRTAFPVQSRNYSKKEADLTNRLWAETFKDVQFDVLTEATMMYVKAAQNGFFPSPGQIMHEVNKIHRRNHITGGRSWEELERLERDYIIKCLNPKAVHDG